LVLLTGRCAPVGRFCFEVSTRTEALSRPLVRNRVRGSRIRIARRIGGWTVAIAPEAHVPAHLDLIDRDDLVLLVVDVQDRLAAAMRSRPATVAATARLVRAAAIIGVPVVVTRQYPKGLGGTVPEVEAALDDARRTVSVVVVDKTAFCACDEQDFMAALEATGRRQVAIAGMETHICVTQTALALEAAGYRVQVVEDACCSRRPRDHKTALSRVQSQGVTVTCSESVIYEAAARAGTEEFKRLLAVVKEG
jgi:nicotinamidase-related amidase